MNRKQIPGFDDRYFADADGHIYRSGEAMPEHRQNGYACVTIYNRTHYVHRLMCLAFHGAPPTKEHQVAHQDGIKSHNQPSNLAWKTARANNADKKRHGTDQTGMRHPNAALTDDAVLAMRRLRATGASLAELSEQFSTSVANVSFVCTGRSWKHLLPQAA